jgi:hypothetical protein
MPFLAEIPIGAVLAMAGAAGTALLTTGGNLMSKPVTSWNVSGSDFLNSPRSKIY